MQQGFPQQQFQPPPGAPQGFAPPQGPQSFAPPQQQAPQQFAAPPQQAQAPAQAAAPDPALNQKLDQILANQAQIFYELNVIQAGVCASLRVTYNQPGEPNLRAFLAQLGLQLPQ
jgi:hypothetical protein